MEQGNVAKKLTGQILENWLLTLADGHGGIQTITKTGTSGLVDTYTIAFADETTSTFTVTNGRSISGLTTSKSGKVTTITITYNDNTTSSFTVRDGENVSSITEYWAVSTSGSQQPQSGWQTTPPTLTATYKYLWHYSKYTFSDGTNTSTTPAVQGVYGDKGDTGNTGTSITSVTKTGTSGLVDTYTIAFSNGTTTTFNVTNGSEIESIEKTSTAGLVDTYTVTMGSGDTHTFTVTNGRSIVSFTQTSGTHAAGTIDVYTMTYNDGDTSQIQVYNGANGTGAVSTVAGIGVSSADGDVPLIIRGYGAPTTATVGQVNQLYFDMTGGIMYICIASAGGSYDWRGMSSAVDSAMSTTSANPLQNRVISNKVGVGSLSSDFTATNLTDAANELMTAMGGKAPTSHASSATTYGKGTSTNYGHVKISDSLTDTTPAATGGIVPSMKAVSDLNGAINDVSTRGAGYTPSFTLDPNSPPTIDNVMFSYVKVSPNLLMVFGRFRLYAKNTTRTDLSLKFSLPSGFTSDTGRPNSFGVVFGPSAITDFVLALSSGSSTIELALGGSRSYSVSTLTDGDNAYYSVIAFIPIN